MDVARHGVHASLDGLVEHVINYPGSEQAVTLLQSGVITNERVEIALVALRDDHVHPAPALLSGPADEVDVLRRGHDYGKKAYVFAKPVVFLAAALEALALSSRHSEGQFLVGASPGIGSLRHCEILPSFHQHGICHA